MLRRLIIFHQARQVRPKLLQVQKLHSRLLLLTPHNYSHARFWVSRSFTTPIPSFNTSYTRIVLAIVPAYYVFELTTTEPFDLFTWIHHGIVLTMVPIVVTSALTKTAAEAAYLTNMTAFVEQTFSANLIFFAGHAIARILPDGRRRYKFYFFLAAYQCMLTATLQIIMWTYFGASVRQLSNWIPIVMTVVTATRALSRELAHRLGYVFNGEECETSSQEGGTARTRCGRCVNCVITLSNSFTN